MTVQELSHVTSAETDADLFARAAACGPTTFGVMVTRLIVPP